MNKSKKDKPKEDIQSKLDSLKTRIKNQSQNLLKKNDDAPVKPLTEDELFYFGKPVSPRVFINSPEFFGNEGKDVVYPWIIEIMEEIFSAEYYLPAYTTAAIIAGKGSGKSYLAGIMNAYLWYLLLSFRDFTKYLKQKDNIHLDPTTTIQLVGMAKHRDQAKKIVFDNTKKAIYRVRAFRERGWLPDAEIETELQYSEFNQEAQSYFKKLIVVPGNSSETFALGFALFGGFIDEVLFWKEKNENPAEKVYNEFEIRRFSRFKNNGIVVLISSAGAQGDFMERFENLSKEDPNIYFCRKSQYDCDPKYIGEERFQLTVHQETSDGTVKEITLYPPVSMRAKYEKNRIETLRDVDSIPALTGSPFYTDWAIVEEHVNRARTDPCPDLGFDKVEGPKDLLGRLPGNFRGVDGCIYRIHVDLAKGDMKQKQCAAGFALAHRYADPGHGYKIKLDLAVRFKAPPGKEIDINDLLNLIKALKTERNFNIDLVTFDQWQSMQPIQTIKGWPALGVCQGINAEELAVDYKQHAYLKNTITTGQFDFYEDRNLFHELKHLEDFGNQRLAAGEGALKDEADAVAGVVFSVATVDAGFEIKKPRASSPVAVRGGTGLPGPKIVGQYKHYDRMPNYRRGVN